MARRGCRVMPAASATTVPLAFVQDHHARQRHEQRVRPAVPPAGPARSQGSVGSHAAALADPPGNGSRLAPLMLPTKRSHASQPAHRTPGLGVQTTTTPPAANLGNTSHLVTHPQSRASVGSPLAVQPSTYVAACGTAVARMGCCTSLWCGMTGASIDPG